MTEATATPGGEKPGADWARAAEGIQLAGFAVFLLLNTMGYLPWSFWLDAIALWPLLIMSAGIRIAFEKTRAPWLVLARPRARPRRARLAGQRGEAGGTGGAVGARGGRQARGRGARESRGEARRRAPARRRRDADAPRPPRGRRIDRRPRHHAPRDGHGRAPSPACSLNAGEKHGIVFLPRRKERWDLRLPAELPLAPAGRGRGRRRRSRPHRRHLRRPADGWCLHRRRLPACPRPGRRRRSG